MFFAVSPIFPSKSLAPMGQISVSLPFSSLLTSSTPSPLRITTGVSFASTAQAAGAIIERERITVRISAINFFIIFTSTFFIVIIIS